MMFVLIRYTQPLYNTIFGIQANFRVSYPNRVISRVKCIGFIGKGVFDSHLGSSPDPCYIQNRVISGRVIKRFRYIMFHLIFAFQYNIKNGYNKNKQYPVENSRGTWNC